LDIQSDAVTRAQVRLERGPEGWLPELFINDALSHLKRPPWQPYACRRHLMKPLRIAIAEDNWLVAEYLCGELVALGHALVGRARTGRPREPPPPGDNVKTAPKVLAWLNYFFTR
jgi:hypothetical protein